MDYTEAQEAFFQPREADDAPHGWDDRATPGRTLRDAIEPIATICYWAEPAYDQYEAVGLDFLGGYIWGRACVLGEPDPAVAASSFGMFEPGLVMDLYTSSRGTCSLADIRAAKQDGAVEALELTMGRPDDLGDVVAVLRRGAEAADFTGRALSAGLAGQPWPEDVLAQLFHVCGLLREHRGDGHLAVCVAAGLDGVEANLLTEMAVGWEPLAYTGTRGWSEDAMADALVRLEARGLVEEGSLSEEGRSLRQELEDNTDRLVQPVIDAIGTDLDDTVATLRGWSDSIVDRGWFPPDPYKRASG